MYTNILVSEINNQLNVAKTDLDIHKTFIGKYFNDYDFYTDTLHSLLNNHSYVLQIEVTEDKGKKRILFPTEKNNHSQVLPDPVINNKQNGAADYTWSECTFVPALSTYVIALTVPFAGGFITQYMDFIKMIRGALAYDIGENNIFVLLDKQGNILIRNTPLNQDTIELIIKSVKSQNQKQQKEILKNVLFDHKYYHLYTNLIKETGWVVVILQSVSEIYVLAGKYILFLAIFTLFIFGITLFYSAKQWQPIIRIIEDLITSTGKVTNGEYDLEIKTSIFQETVELEKRFLLMVKAIKQRENDLVESNQKIIKIFESSPYGLTLTDLNGNIIDCNTSAALLHGYASREEIIGTNTFQLITYEDLDKAKDNLVRTMNEGSIHNVEYTFLKKNGDKFFGTLSSSIITNAENNPVAFIEITTDITKQKLIQAERENIINSLEQKQAELERFIYAVSHDLRSPLITIKGFLGFVQEDVKNNQQEQFLQDLKRISNAVDKMNNLLNDLLELSRIGRVLNEKEPIALNSVLHEVSEILTGLITEKGITLEIQPDLPVVYGNYERLIELFQNLVENSIKYMGKQQTPKITIGCKKNKFETVFFVKDNGIGIDPRYHEKIFGLFDQLDRNSPGTGIGLAIVKRIVETHNGNIWVESEGKEKGTAFYFTLKLNEG